MPPPIAVDDDPTVVQALPGVPRRSPSPIPEVAAASAPGPDDRTVPSDPIDLRPYQRHDAYPDNPLIAAAGTLFDLMVEITPATEHPDIAELQRRIVEEIRRFEQRAAAAGCTDAQVKWTRYVLCSALDEVVLTTPWGGASVWSQRSLLSIFHNETWGGEMVFALLERLRRNPERDADVIELIGLTLALGFQGRYRVMENGRAELEELRSELYREVGRRRRQSSALSVDWEGVQANVRLRNPVPIWVVLAVTGTVILGMFAWFEVRMIELITPTVEKAISIAPPASDS